MMHGQKNIKLGRCLYLQTQR